MQFFRRKLALVLLAGIISLPLTAQTALKLETLLQKPVLSWSDAAVFVLEASEAAVYNNPADAFTFAMEKKWLPKNAMGNETAQLNGIALLLMQSFGLKGGIFYGIGKSPHHAYRELVYKRIIRGDSDPRKSVSGEELLAMVSRILSNKEKEAEGGI